jgi:hypothetical protein
LSSFADTGAKERGPDLGASLIKMCRDHSRAAPIPTVFGVRAREREKERGERERSKREI